MYVLMCYLRYWSECDIFILQDDVSSEITSEFVQFWPTVVNK